MPKNHQSKDLAVSRADRTRARTDANEWRWAGVLQGRLGCRETGEYLGSEGQVRGFLGDTHAQNQHEQIFATHSLPFNASEGVHQTFAEANLHGLGFNFVVDPSRRCPHSGYIYQVWLI